MKAMRTNLPVPPMPMRKVICTFGSPRTGRHAAKNSGNRSECRLGAGPLEVHVRGFRVCSCVTQLHRVRVSIPEAAKIGRVVTSLSRRINRKQGNGESQGDLISSVPFSAFRGPRWRRLPCSFSTHSRREWRPWLKPSSPRARPGRRSSMATTGQKLAVTRAYQNAPLKPNGEVSACLTPRNCSVAFCSLPG